MSRDALSNDGDDHPLIEADMQLSSQHGDGGTPSVDHRQITSGTQNLVASLTDDMDLGPRFAAPYGTKIDVWRTRGTLTISFPRAARLGDVLCLAISCLVWYGFLVLLLLLAIVTGQISPFTIIHWIAGLLPLSWLANACITTHVHINEKAFSITYSSIGSIKFWKSEKRGTFEHLYKAEVTRIHRDKRSAVMLYDITLHEGAICHEVESRMSELEAQWLRAEINFFLAELKGQPPLPQDSDNCSLLHPPPNDLAIKQGTAMGVVVEAPIAYDVPSTITPVAVLPLGTHAMVPPIHRLHPTS